MKLMKTEEAVGQILCHDMTQIIPGVKKDAVFRKGHVITEADIAVLLSIGKDHVYIWENNENMLHENDAAQMLYDMCADEYMRPTPVKEGKIELIAEIPGLFKVDRKKLLAVNALGDMMIASRQGDFPVAAGDRLAGTRVIPLVIEKRKMEEAKRVASGGPIFRILPFAHKRVGIVTTGNEVFYGRIEDTFSPVVQAKLREFGCEMAEHVILNDDHEKITAAIRDMLTQMGVPVRIDDDEMAITGMSLTQRLLTGRLLKGGRYTSRGDHRMVMALRVAELGADAPVEIDDEACVAKSYPGFHRAWAAVRAAARQGIHPSETTAGNPA